MSDLGQSGAVTADTGRVTREVDLATLPRDALYGAACTFTDRCFVGIHAVEASRVEIVLRPKPGRPFDAAALATELADELEGQAFRSELVAQGRDFAAAVRGGAYGAPGPGSTGDASIDDLNTFTDPLEPTADPLGIAAPHEKAKAP